MPAPAPPRTRCRADYITVLVSVISIVQRTLAVRTRLIIVLGPEVVAATHYHSEKLDLDFSGLSMSFDVI